jgi:hypothetical protein
MGIAQSDAFRYQAQQHAEADAVKVATND